MGDIKAIPITGIAVGKRDDNHPMRHSANSRFHKGRRMRYVYKRGSYAGKSGGGKNTVRRTSRSSNNNMHSPTETRIKQVKRAVKQRRLD